MAAPPLPAKVQCTLNILHNAYRKLAEDDPIANPRLAAEAINEFKVYVAHLKERCNKEASTAAIRQPFAYAFQDRRARASPEILSISTCL